MQKKKKNSVKELSNEILLLVKSPGDYMVKSPGE
jgi:hypothetical protein